MIIWLASYPKSGNTWVRAIINQLLQGNKNSKQSVFSNIAKNIRQFPANFDFEGISKFNEIKKDPNKKKELIHETIKNWILVQDKINLDDKIKIFKTHNINAKFTIDGKNYPFTNENNTIGVIHIVRDPRNIISSIKNYFPTVNTEDEATKMILNQNTWSGLKGDADVPNFFSSWSNHYNSWKKFPKNKLQIKYEELLKNPKTQVKKMITFLNNFYKLENDESIIDEIVTKTSFKNLKIAESKGEFTEKLDKEKSFFNLGPKNDWRVLIKKENASRIEAAFKDEMKELDYL